MKQILLTTLLTFLHYFVFAQVTVQKVILFEFDKAVIQAKEHQKLSEILDFSKKEPTAKITLHGHTDNYGSNNYNQRLSKKRVDAVADYLLNHGVQSSQLVLKPYGETTPIVENSTDKNRQKNRRVVVTWQVPEQIVTIPKSPKRKVIIVEKKAPKQPVGKYHLLPKSPQNPMFFIFTVIKIRS